MSMLLLRNGMLIDGTGSPPRAENLLIAGDRIAELGHFEPPADALEIDCAGLTISPGFIDAHGHSDLQVLENRREKVLQGVTTEVVGNCGFSAYPMPSDRRLLHDFANGIFNPTSDWGWDSAAAYLAEVRRRTTIAHVLSLLGHGTLRTAQAGNRAGPLPEPDVEAMEQKTAEAFSQGACGFSTGLMYAPGADAPFEELERLCRVVARFDKIYATHMRSYADQLLESIEEQIELATRSGCKLQISHLQAAGPRNWDKQSAAIEKIEKARQQGVDVAFDCYPYTAGSTVLTQLLPQGALEGGTERMLARLSDQAERARIAAETVAGLAQRWTDIYISAVESETNRALVGRNLLEIAEWRACEPVEVLMDLISEERGAVNIVSFNQSEQNLRQTLTHALSIVVSDGFYVKGRPHPRLYGTFPLLLGEMCRNRRWLSLAEAVRKITDAPARRFGIPNRGRLERGYFADIVVFDEKTVFSKASYENPQIAPVGIRHVFREGKLVASESV